MPKLTKRTIEATKPSAKNYMVFDDQLPGFGLRIMPTGQKSYFIQYRRTRRLTFGRHGPMTPSEARNRAIELLPAVRAIRPGSLGRTAAGKVRPYPLRARRAVPGGARGQPLQAQHPA